MTSLHFGSTPCHCWPRPRLRLRPRWRGPSCGGLGSIFDHRQSRQCCSCRPPRRMTSNRYQLSGCCSRLISRVMSPGRRLCVNAKRSSSKKVTPNEHDFKKKKYTYIHYRHVLCSHLDNGRGRRYDHWCNDLPSGKD
jgi:hypothetical protein